MKLGYRRAPWLVWSLLTLLFMSGCDFRSLIGGEEPPPILGLYKTTNRGESWQYLTASPVIPVVGAAYITLDPNVPGVVYYAGENVGLYKSWNAGADWESLNGGLPVSSQTTIQVIRFHPQDSNTLFLVGQFDQNGRVMRGVNGGEGWEYLYLELPRVDNVSDFMVDPTDGERYFAISNSRAFLVSEDAGVSWKAVHWFEGKPTILAINVAKPDTIWVSDDENGLQKSLDSGVTWQSVQTRDMSRTQSNLAFNPSRPEGIYVAAANGLYFSPDAGETWEWFSDTLPVERQRINAIDFYPGNGEMIYLAIANNIYITTNHGASWEVKKLEVAESISTMRVSPADADMIYAGVSDL